MDWGRLIQGIASGGASEIANLMGGGSGSSSSSSSNSAMSNVANKLKGVNAVDPYDDQKSDSEKKLQGMSEEAWKSGKQDYSDAQNQYRKYRGEADSALANDFGASGEEYARKSQAYGNEYAGDVIGREALGARASTAASARQAGVGEGMAALMGGAAGTNAWGNYNNAMQTGIGNYQTAAQNFQQAKAQQMGREAQQQQFGLNQQQMGMGGMGQVMGVQLSPYQAQMNQYGKEQGYWGTAGLPGPFTEMFGQIGGGLGFGPNGNNKSGGSGGGGGMSFNPMDLFGGGSGGSFPFSDEKSKADVKETAASKLEKYLYSTRRK